MIPAPVAAFASRVGLTGLAIAVLCLLLAVQTVRLEGLRIWPLSIEGARPKAERMERERDQCADAGKLAGEKAKAQKLAVEARYKELADNADEQLERAQADAAAATERYIAANRVQDNRVRSSGTVATAEGGSPGSGDGPRVAPELVAVSEDDIRICTTNTIRLEAAREWGLGLRSED